MDRPVRIAQVGFGMFGSHEVARSIESIARDGVAPFLGRIGYARYARELADIRYEVCAVGTRSEASAKKAADQYEQGTGIRPKACWGDAPWDEIIEEHRPDVLVITTPDDAHTIPARKALEYGVHVIVEKPLALTASEVIGLCSLARDKGCLLGSDNHKEYDPDHLYIAREIIPKIGPVNYGRAYLEEPLEVSTSTFKWVAEKGKAAPVHATPFSYVGIHWVSLIQNMYGRSADGAYTMKPVHVTGHGQKNLLRDRYGIDAVDSTVVTVTYDSGATIVYENNWITPEAFCGIVVNQGHEIVGANGKVESDQQNRGLVYWVGGNGPDGSAGKLTQRTANTHFFRPVYALGNARPDSWCGYGMDAITAFLAAAGRVLRKEAALTDVEGSYIDGVSQILPCAVIEAGNMAIRKNLDLKAAGPVPDAACSIDMENGITMRYTDDKGNAAAESVYTGPLTI